MKRTAVLAVLLLGTALPAAAQDTALPAPGSIPPNAIDRAAARDAEAARRDNARAAQDRTAATADARSSATLNGPVPGSTMNDGPGGVSGTGSVSAAVPYRSTTGD